VGRKGLQGVGISRKRPDPIDQLVGRNIRIRRLERGLSQTALAERLGLTFQQVQKYEKGANRVGSGRLFQIASVLGIPIAALFEGSGSAQDSPEQSLMDHLVEPQSMRLIQAFSEISDPEVRRALAQLVEKIARAR